MSTHSPDPPVGSDPANGRPSSDPPPPPANADRLATTPAAAAGPTAPIVIRPGAPGLPPMFLDRSAQFAVQGQQRASLSSMLFMTFFFFMMSNNGNDQTTQDMMETLHRTREVDWAQTVLGEFECKLNGTKPVDRYGNFTTGFDYPAPVEPEFENVMPPRVMGYPLEDKSGDDVLYWRNITGFYRNAKAHYLNLTDPSTSPSIHNFFHHLIPSAPSSTRSPPVDAELDPYSNEAGEFYIPPLVNMTSYNETIAADLRGEFGWESMVDWEMNIREKKVVKREENGKEVERDDQRAKHGGAKGGRGNDSWIDDWTWTQASITFSNPTDITRIAYDLKGFHHLPSGTYTLLGRPEDQFVDIRQIPSLYPEGAVRNQTEMMILWELRRRWKVARETMLLAVHGEEYSEPKTNCPLYLQFRLVPFPSSYSKSMYDAFESEQQNPSGIRIPGPPVPMRIEGVGILQGCGVAFGMEKGEGLLSNDFWSKTVNYSAYASLVTIISLLLLVHQMEVTRTPSALAKVSFITIAMMVCSDSWLFSAHLVVAIMSDNTSSLPLLIPGFFCLCTAIVFGPRFAMHINRIQAPETPTTPPVARVTAGAGTANAPARTGTGPGLIAAEPEFTVRTWLSDEIRRYPQLKFIIPSILIFLLIIFDVLPNIVPLFLGAMHSFWVPQIWRNVARGNRKAFTWRFVIGTSIARVALPLYAFGCPDNVFFIEPDSSIWLLVAWVAFQVLVLAAQEQFGPAFFLPKSFATDDSYDYHQAIPQADPEAPQQEFGDCPICMEPIFIDGFDSSDSKTSHGNGTGPSTPSVLNIHARRAYALAPCHHLFHTACLSQWLAIKTTCPLCKRGLPAL